MLRLAVAVCAAVILLTPHASSAQPFPVAPPGTKGLGVFVTGVDLNLLHAALPDTH